MSKSLSNNTINSFFWSLVENFSLQGIQFVISIIMARILSPNDYGILGIMVIFLVISQTFIDSGFTNALITKEDCACKDYSTVFYFNTVISILFWILLYSLASEIGVFFNMPILEKVIPVMSLTFVISSLSSIHKILLIKELNFRFQAGVSIISSLVSGCLGIFLAYYGYGVWALVYQAVSASLISTCLFICYVKWKPKWLFSIKSFKELFGFGSKLLISNLIYNVYNNIYNIVIGKFYNASSLGYFTRADGYSKLVITNISGVLLKVLFPALAKIQSENQKLLNAYHEILQITSFFIFPACFLLAGLANPIIILMISEKWAPCIPLLQILCCASLFDHIIAINTNYLMIKKKSGLILKQQIITRIISILIICISLIGNLYWLALGKLCTSIVSLVVSLVYLKQIYSICIKKIILSIAPIFICSCFLSILSIFLFDKFMGVKWGNLFIVIVLCILLYFLFCRLFFWDIYNRIIYRLKSNR